MAEQIEWPAKQLSQVACFLEDLKGKHPPPPSLSRHMHCPMDTYKHPPRVDQLFSIFLSPLLLLSDLSAHSPNTVNRIIYVVFSLSFSLLVHLFVVLLVALLI